jgi:hypothetical protein
MNYKVIADVYYYAKKDKLKLTKGETIEVFKIENTIAFYKRSNGDKGTTSINNLLKHK